MSQTLNALLHAVLLCALPGFAGAYVITYAPSLQSRNIELSEKLRRLNEKLRVSRGQMPPLFSRQDMDSPQLVSERKFAGVLLLCLSAAIFFATLRADLSPATRDTATHPARSR